MKQTNLLAEWGPTAAVAVAISLMLGGCVSHLDSTDSFGKMQGDWYIKRLDKVPVEETKAYINVNSHTGMLSGFDGCNQVRGQVRVEDGKWFATLAGTRNVCPNALAEQVSTALHQGFASGMNVGSISLGATVIAMTGGDHLLGLDPVPVQQ